MVENARFEAPHGERPFRGPSTDGIDIDSCQRVTVRKCYFAVNDDAVCLKGTKGPFAMDDKQSLATEDIRITDCEFRAGHGVVTLGSEATVVRNVIVENSIVTGKIPLVRLKLRPDTPQLYENIHYRNITLTGEYPVAYDTVFEVLPWRQFFDLKGETPPKSIVRNVTLTNIKGTYGSLGTIQGNAGQTEISNITLRNIDLKLTKNEFKVVDVKNLRMEKVKINGKPM